MPDHALSRAILDAGLPAGSRLLVAVSGGPDSTALLHVLSTLASDRSWQLRVAHVNHHMRDGADADQDFVQRLAAELSLPFDAVSVDAQLTPGLEGSLTSAGIQGVKVAGSFMGQRDEAAIAAGTEAAGTPQALNITAWRTVDVALRHLEGLPIAPDDGDFPTQLLVQSNVGTPSDSYSQPPNYQSLYEQLWKVG